MNIAPPKKHLELGDWVSFHHRACIARKPQGKDYWVLCGKEAPKFTPDNWDEAANKMPKDKLNKTIFVWPEEGEGMIIGMVRRGIGNSKPGYTSGYEYPEYNQGYFEAKEWHWLYCVKQALDGTNFIFVPMWAASKES